MWKRSNDRPARYEATISALKGIREKHRCYGVRSLWDALPSEFRPSYGTCYRLCREHGLLLRRKRSHGITKRNPADQLSEDLVQRDFKAPEPNKKWLSDIT